MKKILKLIPIIMIGIFLTTAGLLADTRILEFGNNLDFGSVNVGKSTTQELTLYNRGDSPLTIEKLRFHENIAQAYSGDYSGVIPAGGEKNVTITFAPKAGMEYMGLVYVESDRTNSNDRSKLLSGVGIDENSSVPSRILEFGENLDFENVRIGESVTKKTTLFNRGNSSLLIFRLYFHEKLKNVFTANPTMIYIPAGGKQETSITFSPREELSYAGLVYFVSYNRTNSGDNSILLQGKGIKVVIPDYCDETTAISHEELRDMIINGRDVTEVNTCKITDMSYLLSLDNRLTDEQKNNIRNFNQDISGWDTSNVINMSNMFSFASSFNQPIAEWNVSNVTNMSSMFRGALKFNQPIEKWNVSNVKDMSSMFFHAQAFNQPIEEWDVSNVTDMGRMFGSTKVFNQPIGEWNISNVTSLSAMFNSAKVFNQDISRWNVSNVRGMSGMFLRTESFNQPIGEWNVSNVTNMDSMFFNALQFNQPLGEWDTSNVTKMDEIFCSARSFNQNIKSWSLSSLVYYGSDGLCTFYESSALEKENNPFVTNKKPKVDAGRDKRVKVNSKVVLDGASMDIDGTIDSYLWKEGDTVLATTLSFDYFPITIGDRNLTLFVTDDNGAIGSDDIVIHVMPESYIPKYYCDESTAITRKELIAKIKRGEDVTSVNTCKITDMSYLFMGHRGFNQDISKWDTSHVINMRSMFYKATYFNQWLREWDVSQVKDMSSMFGYTEHFNLPLKKWDVSNVTDMHYMFEDSRAFNQDLTSWNVNNVTNHRSFASYSKLKDNFNPFK